MAYKSVKKYGYYSFYTRGAANALDREKQSKNKQPRADGPRLTVKKLIAQGMLIDDAIKETLKRFPNLSEGIIKSWIEEEKQTSREVDDDGR